MVALYALAKDAVRGSKSCRARCMAYRKLKLLKISFCADPYHSSPLFGFLLVGLDGFGATLAILVVAWQILSSVTTISSPMNVEIFDTLLSNRDNLTSLMKQPRSRSSQRPSPSRTTLTCSRLSDTQSKWTSVSYPADLDAPDTSYWAIVMGCDTLQLVVDALHQLPTDEFHSICLDQFLDFSLEVDPSLAKGVVHRDIIAVSQSHVYRPKWGSYIRLLNDNSVCYDNELQRADAFEL
ncbi:hypothetical protein KCU62_g451, partial [Aureobasidium sp. EXF-3399]